MSAPEPLRPPPANPREALAYVEAKLGFDADTLLRFPKYFLLETVNMCNARCVMCGIDFDSKTPTRMSDALYARLIEELAEHRDHVEKVMLYLDGEPLLDRALVDRVRRAKDAGLPRINIATNASLLDAQRSAALLDAGLDEVYVTIDSLRKDRFEAIRRGLTFETVVDNTLAFVRERDQRRPQARVRVQMILQRENADEEAAFLDHWAARLGPGDEVVVQKAHNWAAHVQVPAFGDEATINRYPCIALWGTFCVHADGTAPLCCMDSDNAVPVGDTNRERIADIWAGEVLERIRRLHLAGRRAEVPLCDGCTLWREGKQDAKRVVGEAATSEPGRAHGKAGS